MVLLNSPYVVTLLNDKIKTVLGTSKYDDLLQKFLEVTRPNGVPKVQSTTPNIIFKRHQNL